MVRSCYPRFRVYPRGLRPCHPRVSKALAMAAWRAVSWAACRGWGQGGLLWQLLNKPGLRDSVGRAQASQISVSRWQISVLLMSKLGFIFLKPSDFLLKFWHLSWKPNIAIRLWTILFVPPVVSRLLREFLWSQPWLFSDSTRDAEVICLLDTRKKKITCENVVRL